MVGYYGFGNAGDDILFDVSRELIDEIGFEVSALYTKSGRLGGTKLVNRWDPLSVIKEIFRSKALVFGGGGIFQDETSVRSVVYYAALAKIAHFFGKKVILLGSGIGPLRSKLARFLVRWVLRSNKTFVLARDPVTERYARRLSKKVYPGTDLAVLHLSRFSHSVDKKKTAVIVPKKLEDWDDVAEYLERKGYEICFVAVSPEEIGTVRKYVGRYRVVEGDPTGLVVESSIVISERFHPCLISAYSGIPFVSVGEKKTERFFRDLLKGYPGFSRKEKEDIMVKIEEVEGMDIDIRENLDRTADRMIDRFRKILLNL